MKQGFNESKIEGLLKEVKLQDKGAYISGNVIVEVNQVIDGKSYKCDIPVNCYATPVTKAGKANPSYASIKAIMSATAPTYVRVGGARLGSNEYMGRDGKLRNDVRVSGSFFNTVAQTDMEEKAVFDVVVVVVGLKEEVDTGSIPTGRVILTGVIPLYNDNISVVDFIIENPKLVAQVQATCNKGMTVRLNGAYKFTTKSVKEKVDVGFGDPVIKERSSFVNELVLTQEPAFATSEENNYAQEDITAALKVRSAKLEELKEKKPVIGF